MKLFHKSFGNAPEYIVILHGLYGSSDNWQSIAKQLAIDYTVIVPDLRNHGKSPHSSIHSYPSLTQDIIDLLDDMNIKTATLIGHSMGGKVAMTLALLFPERVSRLIVVDIAPRAYQRLTENSSQVSEHMNILSGLISIDVQTIESRTHADLLLSSFVTDSKTRQFLLKNLVRKESHFEWSINISGLHQNLPNIMGAISGEGQFNKPTLFIKGELSNYIQEKDKEEIKKIFPEVEFATIFDAGHWVHAEQPDTFIATITAFLND